MPKSELATEYAAAEPAEPAVIKPTPEVAAYADEIECYLLTLRDCLSKMQKTRMREHILATIKSTRQRLRP
jgi:hypothetical protein